MKPAAIAAAVILTAPFSAVATVVIAAPANAFPCPHNGGAMTQECMDCITAAANDFDAISACNGMAPAGRTPSPWADCNAYLLAADRANCDDQHLLGQR
jgi:hypothetical protein